MNQHPFAFECELPAHEGITEKFKVYFQARAVYPVYVPFQKKTQPNY